MVTTHVVSATKLGEVYFLVVPGWLHIGGGHVTCVRCLREESPWTHVMQTSQSNQSHTAQPNPAWQSNKHVQICLRFGFLGDDAFYPILGVGDAFHLLPIPLGRHPARTQCPLHLKWLRGRGAGQVLLVQAAAQALLHWGQM